MEKLGCLIKWFLYAMCLIGILLWILLILNAPELGLILLIVGFLIAFPAVWLLLSILKAIFPEFFNKN